ncbi:MAG TPA: tetratricopeptide repeat protein [Gemmataceae bacterium]
MRPAGTGSAARWLRPGLGVLALAAGGVLLWRLAGGPGYETGPAPPEPVPDPRTDYDTPFVNVRPGVRYVGDAACLPCHEDIARTFSRHPMGNSAAPARGAATAEESGAGHNNPFTAFGLTFRVRREGGKLIHEELVAAGDGKEPFARLAAEVDLVIGSGRHGKSYVVSRDGFLYQSPISWYSGKQVWDISPGYHRDRHFTRAVGPECLFCHTNHAGHVPGTVNRYEPDGFRGHSIGCERCHGPGEAHARKQGANPPPAGFDETIVNPTHLAAPLREAVCQQCHLQGEKRVLRRGRDWFEFRPGMPVYAFWSVFVRLPEFTDRHKAVGQFEQMHLSRCYLGSGGRLDCTSCHNPHRAPAPEERVAYFRSRCLNCHRDRGCSLPEPRRLGQHPDDDCTACHMPKGDVTRIAHTALTDHRVLRRPDPSRGKSSPPRPLRPGEVPILHYHRGQEGVDEAEVRRALGIALGTLALQQGPRAFPLVPMALERLEESVRRWPDDVAAWEARGNCLRVAARFEEALRAYERALELAPDREEALSGAAAAASALGETERAVELCRRLLRVNPWEADYHYLYASLLSREQDWPAAEAACRKCLGLHPTHPGGRQLRVACLLRLGREGEARAEFERLLALEPARGFELRRWFAGEAGK